MVCHYVRIVKLKDIEDIIKLKNHKKVVMFVDGPRDYIFFEYFDKVLLKRWNGPPEVKYSQDVMEKVNNIEMDIQNLLRPLYSKVDSKKNVFMTGMQLFIGDTLYFHPTIKKIKYINFKYNHDKAPTLHGLEFSVKFKKCEDKYIALYEKILNEWAIWAKERGFLKLISPIEYTDVNLVRVGIDFHSNVTVCILALFMMLNEMKPKSVIDYLCFD